jgi:hypothetical protein
MLRQANELVTVCRVSVALANRTIGALDRVSVTLIRGPFGAVDAVTVALVCGAVGTVCHVAVGLKGLAEGRRGEQEGGEEDKDGFQ